MNQASVFVDFVASKLTGVHNWHRFELVFYISFQWHSDLRIPSLEGSDHLTEKKTGLETGKREDFGSKHI